MSVPTIYRFCWQNVKSRFRGGKKQRPGLGKLVSDAIIAYASATSEARVIPFEFLRGRRISHESETSEKY